MRVVVPAASKVPSGGTLVITFGQLSETETKLLFSAHPHRPGEAGIVKSGVQLMLGVSVSLTTTVTLHESVLPDVSVAVNVAAVGVSTGTLVRVLDGGEIVGAGSQLSVAEIDVLKIVTEPVQDPAVLPTSNGAEPQSLSGGTLSVTLTFKMHESVDESSAVTVNVIGVTPGLNGVPTAGLDDNVVGHGKVTLTLLEKSFGTLHESMDVNTSCVAEGQLTETVSVYDPVYVAVQEAAPSV
jgi:hypothetical protein